MKKLLKFKKLHKYLYILFILPLFKGSNKSKIVSAIDYFIFIIFLNLIIDTYLNWHKFDYVKNLSITSFHYFNCPNK